MTFLQLSFSWQYKCTSFVNDKILNIKEWKISLGGSYLRRCEVTLQISPCMAILTSMGKVTWHPPCVPSCRVVPATTQKSPHMVILTTCGKSHLAPTSFILMSSCPHHHAKVTSHDHSHLMQQTNLSSISHTPLYAKIISFTLHGKIPKKFMQQPLFHQ